MAFNEFLYLKRQGIKAMNKILIIFDTVSNSTQEASEIIFRELSASDDTQVELSHYSDVSDFDAYDTIIIGSPMRFKNFHPNIRKFIKKNRGILARKKVMCFLTCLYLIKDLDYSGFDFPVFSDPSFNAIPMPLKEMNMMDKTHSDSLYVAGVLENGLRPVSIAYFKGRLDLKSLGFFSRVFMKVVLMLTNKEQIGDFLDPESVAEWAREIKQTV